jgi:hypothetical protein
MYIFDEVVAAGFHPLYYGLTKAIVRFANTPNPKFRKYGGDIPKTLWGCVISQWDNFH